MLGPRPSLGSSLLIKHDVLGMSENNFHRTLMRVQKERRVQNGSKSSQNSRAPSQSIQLKEISKKVVQDFIAQLNSPEHQISDMLTLIVLF